MKTTNTILGMQFPFVIFSWQKFSILFQTLTLQGHIHKPNIEGRKEAIYNMVHVTNTDSTLHICMWYMIHVTVNCEHSSCAAKNGHDSNSTPLEINTSV